MSFSANRSASLAAFLLACTLGPRAADALELKLWPLVDYERSDTTTRLGLLGPLVEWRRDTAATRFTIRPLFDVTRERSSGVRHGSLLYPVAWWKSSLDQSFVRFFGLVSYETNARPVAASPWTRRFTAFPLVFFRQGPETGTSLSVLPLYANLTGFFGYERIRMFLFPLYLKLVEPLYERTWLPFPFFSRVGGRMGRGTRVWPVYGQTIVGLGSETTYVGWPFYIRHVDHPLRRDATITRISWPLFSVIEGPTLESRTYGYLLVLPLYTRTIDRRSGTVTKGFPWPFWVSQRSLDTGERLSLRLMPIYQDRRTPLLHSTFYAWPFYRRREGLGESSGYERTDVLFVLYRDQSEGRGAADRLHTRVLLPLWVSRSGPNASRAQALTLLDGIFPKNEALEHLYAPLVRLYGSVRDESGARHDVLWRLWEWGGGRFRPPLYVSRD